MHSLAQTHFWFTSKRPQHFIPPLVVCLKASQRPSVYLTSIFVDHPKGVYMQLHTFALPLLLVLSGCSGIPLGNAPTTASLSSEKVTTVCALYERACTATRAASLPAPLDIVIGCPGRTSLKSQRSPFERSAAVKLATSVPVPTSAGDTDYARRLFQRMISRGVPVEVAVRMTGTRAFARALAARL